MPLSCQATGPPSGTPPRPRLKTTTGGLPRDGPGTPIEVNTRLYLTPNPNSDQQSSQHTLIARVFTPCSPASAHLDRQRLHTLLDRVCTPCSPASSHLHTVVSNVRRRPALAPTRCTRAMERRRMASNSDSSPCETTPLLNSRAFFSFFLCNHFINK